MRRFTLCSIAVEDFSETNRKVLEAYLSHDKRNIGSGYFVTWLPLERDAHGGVTFCVSNLVTTPVTLIRESKRYNKSTHQRIHNAMLEDVRNHGTEANTLLRENYSRIATTCCKDWKLPPFDIAITKFRTPIGVNA